MSKGTCSLVAVLLVAAVAVAAAVGIAPQPTRVAMDVAAGRVPSPPFVFREDIPVGERWPRVEPLPVEDPPLRSDYAAVAALRITPWDSNAPVPYPKYFERAWKLETTSDAMTLYRELMRVTDDTKEFELGVHAGTILTWLPRLRHCTLVSLSTYYDMLSDTDMALRLALESLKWEDTLYSCGGDRLRYIARFYIARSCHQRGHFDAAIEVLENVHEAAYSRRTDRTMFSFSVLASMALQNLYGATERFERLDYHHAFVRRIASERADVFHVAGDHGNLPVYFDHGVWRKITEKQQLADTLRPLREAAPNVYGFHPVTYVMPEETHALEAHIARDPQAVFVSKVARMPGGEGVKFLDMDNLPTISPYVVQEYMWNTFLVDGHKPQIRTFVIVTSVRPLRAYMYDRGIVRLAPEAYVWSREDAMSGTASIGMHITNTLIHKRRGNANLSYPTAGNQTCTGNVWTTEGLREHMRRRGYDYERMWSEWKDICALSLISIAPELEAHDKVVASHSHLPKILGFDMMITADGRPVLTEINRGPSLLGSLEIEIDMHRQLLADMWNLGTFFTSHAQKSVWVHSVQRELANAGVTVYESACPTAEMCVLRKDLDMLAVLEREMFSARRMVSILPCRQCAKVNSVNVMQREYMIQRWWVDRFPHGARMWMSLDESEVREAWSK